MSAYEQAEYVRLRVPCEREEARRLRAGQRVLLSGRLYTARDAAHKRMVEALEAGERLPVDLAGAFIYYCGPAPAPPGRAIGSCGPTTAARMDPFVEPLLQAGLVGMIGKGNRSISVRRAIMWHGAVYLVAVGGAGALLASHVREARVVAYDDLGPEAIFELNVEDMPLLVAYDAAGGSVFAGEEPIEEVRT